MADWTFEKALVAIKSPSSISLDTLVSPAGLRPGGHPFCEDTDKPAHADCRNGRPRRVDIEWIIQSAPQA